MIWVQKPNIESINQFCKNTMCETLGMEFLEVGDDFLTARMPVNHNTKQPAGLLHGGASVALAESLGSVASVFCMKDKTTMPVGLEINANHLQSARDGFVYGQVKPIRIGSKTHIWSIEIKNEKQELICISRLTVMIVPAK